VLLLGFVLFWLLRLRDDLESDADLSQFVLYFGKEQVKWKDFYFSFKQYGVDLSLMVCYYFLYEKYSLQYR